MEKSLDTKSGEIIYQPDAPMYQGTYQKSAMDVKVNSPYDIPYHIRWMAWYTLVMVKCLVILGTTPDLTTQSPRFTSNL